MTATAHSKPTPPFKRGGDNVLLEALNERQIRREKEWASEPDSSSGARAISSTEVLEVLEEIGMAEGFDSKATSLFFGEDGREGYTDGGEDLAIETHGGFVFTDHDQGETYTITATTLTGDSLPRSGRRHTFPRRTDNDSFLPEVVSSFFRGKLSSPDFRSSGRRDRSSLQWRVSARAVCYEVQPRFYEEIEFLDLMPFADDVDDPADAGLVSLYPVEKSERISIHTGAVSVSSADEALKLAESLGAVMAEHGVLCDPRVVLMETHNLPLLPRYVRLESLRRANDRDHGNEEDADEDTFIDQSFLGASHSLGAEHDHCHRVKKERGSVVPDQRTAGWLARRAAEYAAYEERVRDLEGRVSDPLIPERRKQYLRPRLQRDASARDEAWSVIEGQTENLAGLLLSVLSERPELVREAHRRQLGL